MLGSVTGSESRRDAYVADIDVLAIAQSVRLVERRRRVPELAAFRGEMQDGTAGVSQITRPGEVVGVDVRLGNVRDANPLGARRARVLSDINVGVDHDRLAGSFTRDEVACLRQIVVVKALQDHARAELRITLLCEAPVVSVRVEASLSTAQYTTT